MSHTRFVRGIPSPLAIAAVLCLCSAAFGTISFSSNTLTYSSPSDLGTTIDPSGLNNVATSYGVSKASFQALNPQVVAFNGAPAPTQTLRTLVVNYTASSTVTFTFPSAMYNYGSMSSVGRGAFSGSSLQDAISTVPTTPDSLNDWFDATIASTGGRGVQSLGFCAAFRNDQAVPAGQVLFTLSDSTTGSVTLPALGGSGNPEYVFIGYTAPTGKTVTRVQASRTSSAGGGWVSVDDLSFVMSPASDTTAPAAVSNLATSSPTASSITLSWTAPGDDGSTGTATTYDIRYSTSTITAGNWASATQVTGEPAPAAAGTNQNMTITGLSADTTYYFAIETADEAPNWSALSNVPSGKTSDTVAPAAVSNLASSSPTNNSITLSWTAPGDNGSSGTATTYDIRYSTSTITSGNWANATQVTGEPAPAAAGTNQNMTITGLNPSTTYYFAIETADEVPNWSALSNVPSGTTTTGGTITFANNTLTYGSPSDLSTTIDPTGLNEVATSYGVTKATFQALNPQVVGFNGAPAPTQTLRTLVAYYNASNTVTFTFPSAMYNYGSMTTLGRGAFSGSSAQDAISTVPTQPDSLYDWFDATITSTGGQGVKALGFCAGFRNDQAVAAGQVLYTLSDATTDTVTLPALGGAGNPEYVFIGYQAPSGKTITRVQASRTSGAGGGYVAVDDLAFVMSGTADTTAPAAVSNLATSSPTSSSITLSWTAPGDDGSTGTATSYDIRYRTGGAVNDSNWASATQVTGEPTPAVAGTNQNMVVSGLSASTTYYFAIKTSDEVPNISAISNSPSGTTSAASDTTPPAAVSNLATSSPTSSSITLTWTAPGDDGSTGTATTYDIRYSTSTITAGNFSSATQVTGVPAPQVAGTNQSVTVSGLSTSTTYYFAMKTADEVPNWSAISNVPSGTTSATDASITIANGYDDAWETGGSGWVQHCTNIKNAWTGKTAGFVVHVGDSITYANPYGAWARGGQGKTSSDTTICSWMHADVTGDGTNNTNSGWWLAAYDVPSRNGSYTAKSGIRADQYLAGNYSLPSTDQMFTSGFTNPDGKQYRDAEVCVLMLGTNDVGAGRTSAAFIADLGSIVDKMQAANVIVVVSTLPPRNGYDTAINDYNTQIRSMAQTKAIPLIDFYQEIVRRRPNGTWMNTLIGSDGIHPSDAYGGYTSSSDPYASNGVALSNSGYLLRDWLSVQKINEVKTKVSIP